MEKIDLKRVGPKSRIVTAQIVWKLSLACDVETWSLQCSHTVGQNWPECVADHLKSYNTRINCSSVTVLSCTNTHHTNWSIWWLLTCHPWTNNTDKYTEFNFTTDCIGCGYIVMAEGQSCVWLSQWMTAVIYCKETEIVSLHLDKKVSRCKFHFTGGFSVVRVILFDSLKILNTLN